MCTHTQNANLLGYVRSSYLSMYVQWIRQLYSNACSASIFNCCERGSLPMYAANSFTYKCMRVCAYAPELAYVWVQRKKCVFNIYSSYMLTRNTYFVLRFAFSCYKLNMSLTFICFIFNFRSVFLFALFSFAFSTCCCHYSFSFNMNNI